MREKNGLLTALRTGWEALAGAASPDPSRSPLSLPIQARLPLSRTALFAEIEDLRVSWRSLAPGIVAHSDRFVNAGWTLAELTAHAASWAKEFREEVEVLSRGGAFDYAIPFALSVVGPNQWNAEQVAARRDRRVEESLAEIERETEKLQELVLSLPDAALYEPALLPYAPSGKPEERFPGSGAMVVLGRCQHDRHHLEQIRARLERWRAG